MTMTGKIRYTVGPYDSFLKTMFIQLKRKKGLTEARTHEIIALEYGIFQNVLLIFWSLDIVHKVIKY